MCNTNERSAVHKICDRWPLQNGYVSPICQGEGRWQRLMLPLLIPGRIPAHVMPTTRSARCQARPTGYSHRGSCVNLKALEEILGTCCPQVTSDGRKERLQRSQRISIHFSSLLKCLPHTQGSRFRYGTVIHVPVSRPCPVDADMGGMKSTYCLL